MITAAVTSQSLGNDEFAARSLGYVWDPIALAYVVATPAGSVGGGGGGGPVTLIDGADVAQGSILDAESVAGAGTVIAVLKRLRTLLSNPLAVTGTFWQVTQPVSIAAAVPITDNAGSLTTDTAQLPAALVGGRLDVNVGASASIAGTIVDGGDVTQGAKADAVWDGVTVATTISAVMKYIGQKIEAVRALLAGTLKVNTSTRTLTGSYRCGSGQIAGAASAQNLLSIENPTGSGKTVYVKRIEVQGPTVTVSLTLKFLYLVGRTTAVPSAGTVLTSQKHQTTDATAAAIVRQGPTATAATGNIWSASGEQLFTAVGAGNPTQNVAFGEPRDSDDIVLAPGEGLLVRAETNNTGYFHSIDVSWEETAP